MLLYPLCSATKTILKVRGDPVGSDLGWLGMEEPPQHAINVRGLEIPDATSELLHVMQYRVAVAQFVDVAVTVSQSSSSWFAMDAAWYFVEGALAFASEGKLQRVTVRNVSTVNLMHTHAVHAGYTKTRADHLQLEITGQIKPQARPHPCPVSSLP